MLLKFAFKHRECSPEIYVPYDNELSILNCRLLHTRRHAFKNSLWLCSIKFFKLIFSAPTEKIIEHYAEKFLRPFMNN